MVNYLKSLLIILFVSTAIAQENLFSVLVFDKTGKIEDGKPKDYNYFFEGGPQMEAMLLELSKKNNFSIHVSNETSLFNDDSLKNYQVVFFVNVMRNVLNTEEQQAFIRYMGNGGGFVGYHATSANRGSWPWFVNDFLGGDNPDGINWSQSVIYLDRKERNGHELGMIHPIMRGIPDSINHYGEWYEWTPNPADNPEITVLQWFDASEAFPNNSNTLMPASWCRSFGDGRMFYTILSHDTAIFQETWYQDMIVNALKWTSKYEPVTSSPYSP